MRTVLGALLAAVLPAVLLAVPASGSPATREAAVPPLWAAPASAPPAGWHTELCPWLSREEPARTLHVALPARFVPVAADRRGCTAFGSRYDESVAVDPAAGTSLLAYRQTEVDPFVATGGDDAVSGVAYASAVPVLGGRLGESLSYEAYNDGAPIEVHLVQADGVRLRWVVAAGEWAGASADAEAAASGLWIADHRRATCSRGRGATRSTVTVDIDREVRWVDASGSGCVLALRGRDRDRAVDVAVRPRHGLGAAYRRLAARDDVRGLRRTSPTRVDHRVLRAGDEQRRVRIVQEGGVRTRLETSPARWREDLARYDALRASMATSWSSPPPGSSTARPRTPPGGPRRDRPSSSASCPPSASPAACACG